MAKISQCNWWLLLQLLLPLNGFISVSVKLLKQKGRNLSSRPLPLDYDAATPGGTGSMKEDGPWNKLIKLASVTLALTV